MVRNTDYQLDDVLVGSSHFIANLALCELRLQNEARFPWIILVPRQDNVYELLDLSADDQIILMQEISCVASAMKSVFDPDKLNIASLGNMVRQLHIHVIARYESDLAWPNPVWGYFEQSARYAEDVLARRIQSLQKHLMNR